ncbi:MAG: helix-turn-helix domain-containing protein [Acutalibacteraceae bacterium]
MNFEKTGKLIRALRREKRLTQKQLADAMRLSDRTVSKWERWVSHS